ncbi:1,4-alpha-glucan branching protein [Streptomyces sp. NPDC005012]|uniref:maltokinase N-terminal cap-like domain-containing protein n=1 Tax=Streptomyces sp. NPDC005012 TaxID=3154558 RepID=UPI0033B25704
MSVIHRTTMAPTKLELVTAWLPGRPWYRGSGTPRLERAGGFRLDDPAGEVGIEFAVFEDADGTVYHQPMTYRAAPSEGAEEALIGTSEHGVLGTRWVYDATRDPVAVEQIVALLAGRAVPQAQSLSDTPDPSVVASYGGPLPGGVHGRASAQDGDGWTDVLLDGVTLRVLRVLEGLAADGTAADGRSTEGGAAGGVAGDADGDAHGASAGVVAGWTGGGEPRRGVFVRVLPA